MSDKRQIYGVWLIERQTGRNIVSRAYSGIEIDMDLIAPFLSATHTFIDKASHENLRIIDTETSRYVWQENEYLLFVMVVSKQARVGLKSTDFPWGSSPGWTAARSRPPPAG